MSSDESATVGLIYQPLEWMTLQALPIAATCFDPTNGGGSLPCDVSQAASLRRGPPLEGPRRQSIIDDVNAATCCLGGRENRWAVQL